MSNSSKALNGNIRSSRVRRNLLKESEFKTIEFLCSIMPKWVFPDLLTAIGVFGSLIVASGLMLSTIHPSFLLLSVFGFAVHWFGDSLDGRLAYYRKTPRKWYGWALDINADWISTCIIGFGCYMYFADFQIIAFVFVVAYGGSMIVSLLRYKISNVHQIDVNGFGPTELRIIISVFMLLEIFFPGVLMVFGLVGSIILIAMNFQESLKVLEEGDHRDAQEKAFKQSAHVADQT